MRWLLPCLLLMGCATKKKPESQPPPWSPTFEQMEAIEGTNYMTALYPDAYIPAVREAATVGATVPKPPDAPPFDTTVRVYIDWSESPNGPWTQGFVCHPFITDMEHKFYRVRIEAR